MKICSFTILQLSAINENYINCKSFSYSQGNIIFIKEWTNTVYQLVYLF